MQLFRDARNREGVGAEMGVEICVRGVCGEGYGGFGSETEGTVSKPLSLTCLLRHF